MNKTLAFLLALAICVISVRLHAQSTAFTYQGRLNISGVPATGLYDFRFKLATDPLANNYLGSDFTNAIPVRNGLFITTIDFGAGIFNGSNYWLEVDVRTNNPANTLDYTVLVPLQSVTPVPSALYAGSASNVLGTVNASQLSGSIAATNISGALTTAQLPANVITNGPNGVNLTGSFFGNGSGLTNLTIATLTVPAGMALIPAGAFTMGNSIGDGDIFDATPTNVYVSQFYMDVNLVSYAQWQSVYFWATNQGYVFDDAGAGKAPNHPVQTVNWWDAVKWSNARAQQAGLTPAYYTDAGLTQIYTNGDVNAVYVNWLANGYRLPTEAEWEKAARGGLSGQRFPWGNIITENLANYIGNSNALNYDSGPNGYNDYFTNGVMPFTSPGGSFAPNGYGLYDMAGNDFAWVWDWYGSPYGQPTNINPTGPATGSTRVIRGCSWNGTAESTRCAFRNYVGPDDLNTYIGFSPHEKQL
jgi:formylglycine-generating enzyme required for sulfatase activity